MSDNEDKKTSLRSGAVAWMARNPVAANLFMFILIFGGLVGLSRMKQEVLPEFDIDIISVSVPYPGASPEDVEQGIILSLEEAVRGVEGVRLVNSNASEGVGSVAIELLIDSDPDKVLSDIKAAVDRVTTFPLDSEEPQTTLLTLRREVISLILSGPQSLETLHMLAERSREELRSEPDITQVDILGVPNRELSIEIPTKTLKSYGLTLEGIAQQIRLTSLELPGGGVKTDGGEVLVRMSERRQTVEEYGEILIRSTFNGAQVRLGDIATLSDGYEDNDQASYFNGERAVRLVIYRIGNETPIEVATAVKGYSEKLKSRLPNTVNISTWDDQSELLRGRIDLLLNNAKFGLILVFGILALFLEARLAFWVAMGIPICFLGSFWLLPGTDASINMVSLFAFIVTLGLVVDDAIVVGENVYEFREKGDSWMDSAIKGSRQMTVPVTFAVLTTITAFSPLLLVPGVSGKFFKLIPIVVIAVLILSLVESFFVLPAHLAHMKDKPPGRILQFIDKPRAWLAIHLNRFTQGPFSRLLNVSVQNRYSTIAVSIAIFLLSIGLVGGGVVEFSFFPKLEGEIITVSAKLPYGAPIAETQRIQLVLENAANETIEDLGGAEGLVRGMYTSLGEGAVGRAGAATGSHLVTLQVALTPSEAREISSKSFSDNWQARIPSLSGVESVKFSSSTGPGAGAAIDIQISAVDLDTLSEVSDKVSATLRSYRSLKDVENSYSSGKNQMDFKLRDAGVALGLTSSEVSRQIRSSFYGSEAIREQVGRLERRTMVRLPKEERINENDISEVQIRTPSGSYVPLGDIVSYTRSRSPTAITREAGTRVVNVKAELASGVVSSRETISSLTKDVFPEIVSEYPGTKLEFVGEQRDQGETFASLGQNYLIALFVIYSLLAIPFKSYLQPLIIMSAIPFGFVGAVLGHMIMQYSMSIISMFGLVALTGVVVNDSLVLIDSANQYRASGYSAFEAIQMGAKRRLRPIILTSLTTFLGLAPMIVESSIQAKFLIPMAISLGFGVLFATLIILLLVPALYMLTEDLKAGFEHLKSQF